MEYLKKFIQEDSQPIEFIEEYGIYYKTLIKIPVPKELYLHSNLILYHLETKRSFIFSKTYHPLNKPRMIFTPDGIVYEDLEHRDKYQYIIDQFTKNYNPIPSPKSLLSTNMIYNPPSHNHQIPQI